MRDRESLDRHALVTTIWLGLGFAAAVLFAIGADGRPGFILSGFGVLIVAFAGHVVVNVATGTRFTTGELALGLVVYAAALLAFALAALLAPEVRALLVPVGIGFAGLLLAMLLHLVTAFGLRGTFDAFDTITSFRADRR